jgi:hypothetical protein
MTFSSQVRRKMELAIRKNKFHKLDRSFQEIRHKETDYIEQSL